MRLLIIQQLYFSEGVINELWTAGVRLEIANQIMNLGCLSAEQCRTQKLKSSESSSISDRSMRNNDCRMSLLKMAKFWVSVAALSLLRNTHWLELSPIWQKLQVVRKENFMHKFTMHLISSNHICTYVSKSDFLG